MLYSQFFNSNSTRYFILILGIIAFLTIKLFYLPIPYFWDESWVYGPAVSEMGKTIPSLLPGSIDIDLSRGHPMLFHFLGGIWGKIFGISVPSLHAFALLISVTLLYFFYSFSKNHLPNSRHYAVFFLAFTGIFLAQSAMVLPEVLVSLFVLLSLFSFSRGKHNLSILFASLCLLSKESGAVLFPVLGLSFLAHQLLTNSFSWKKSFIFLFKLILGVLPYALFLMVQKMRFGWVFYPNHLDLQIDTIARLRAQFISAFEYVFYSQGIIPFILEIKKHYKKHHLLFLTITLFFFVYLLFTAMNFYSSRYILCLIPLSIFVCFRAIDQYFKHTLVHLLTIAIIGVSVILALKREPISDVNQSFVDVGRAQKALFEYLEEEELYDEVFLAPFLVHESLKKVYAGHRSNTIPFKNVPYYPSPDQAFYNIKNFEGELINSEHKKGRKKTVVKEFKSGDVSYILEKYTAVQK